MDSSWLLMVARVGEWGCGPLAGLGLSSPEPQLRELNVVTLDGVG